MDIITDNSFKYDLEKLDSTSDEFILVKQFHDITVSITNYNGNSKKALGYTSQIENFQIYKVNENIPTESAQEKNNNLMLFHGTNRKGAVGILKEGFKNSRTGWFGRGVYMTDCSEMAYMYSKGADKGISKMCYIFVNEVLESERLQTFEIDDSKFTGDVDTPLKNPFNKHIHESSPQITEENYKEDHKGRKYRNIEHENTSVFNYSSAFDEYIAEESVTIPRYLIISKF